MKVEAKIIIEDGIVSFEGTNCSIVGEIYRVKLEEAYDRGKRRVIEKILHNIEKLAN